MNRIKFRVWDKKLNKYVEFNPIWVNFDSNDFIFEQWTGAVTSYDQKIYEGDIIEGFDEYGGQMKGEVVYSPEYTAFIVKTSVKSIAKVGDWAKNVEILGNIHEKERTGQNNPKV